METGSFLVFRSYDQGFADHYAVAMVSKELIPER